MVDGANACPKAGRRWINAGWLTSGASSQYTLFRGRLRTSLRKLHRRRRCSLLRRLPSSGRRNDADPSSPTVAASTAEPFINTTTFHFFRHEFGPRESDEVACFCLEDRDVVGKLEDFTEPNRHLPDVSARSLLPIVQIPLGLAVWTQKQGLRLHKDFTEQQWHTPRQHPPAPFSPSWGRYADSFNAQVRRSHRRHRLVEPRRWGCLQPVARGCSAACRGRVGIHKSAPRPRRKPARSCRGPRSAATPVPEAHVTHFDHDPRARVGPPQLRHVRNF